MNSCLRTGFTSRARWWGRKARASPCLEVVGNLVYSPPARTLLVLGYPDVYSAGDHIPEVVAAHPIGCEGIDDRLIEYYKKKGEHVKDTAHAAGRRRMAAGPVRGGDRNAKPTTRRAR